MASTHLRSRVEKLLASNARGQVGMRDQFEAIREKLGSSDARRWLEEHIGLTFQFREILADELFCFGDAESTGYRENDVYVEFAVANSHGRRWESLINPQRPISESSTGVHGITDAMVSDAPTWPIVHPRLNTELRNYKALGGYNFEFDVRLAEQTCFEFGTADVEWPIIIDIMPLAATWVGDWDDARSGWKWHKLEGGHRAMGDVIELIDVVRLMSTSSIEYAERLLNDT